MNNRDIIARVQEETNIIGLVGRYVSLKKKGQRYIGLCPFHEEKTPSFIVNAEKKLFYCFGCKEGGSLYHFVMKYRRCTFYEALIYLGSLIGLDVHKLQLKRNSHFDAIRNFLEQASQFYHKQLLDAQDGHIAMLYLKKRRIESALVNKFRLGFAPSSKKDGLHQFFRSHLDFKIQMASNLVRQNQYARTVDYFRNRLIFPIFDEWNQIVAFGGRVLNDASYPKYLNSPESAFFKKSNLLYGLNFAKSVLKDDIPLIIVEGYFDVLMAHQYGIENIVSPLGTGLTREHLQKISRYTNAIVLMFDGDSAGHNALIRSLPNVLEQELHTTVVILDSGLDPYDYLVQFGADAFKKLIQDAPEAIDYYIQWQWDKIKPKTWYQKRCYLNVIYRVMFHLSSEVQKEEVLKKLTSFLNVSFSAVRQDYYKQNQSMNKTLPKGAKLDAKDELSGRKKTERHLLFVILNHIEYYLLFQGRLIRLEWSDSLSKKILNSIEKFFSEKMKSESRTLKETDVLAKNGSKLDVNGKFKEQFLHTFLNWLASNLFSDEEKQQIKKELTQHDKYDESPKQQIDDCLNQLRIDVIKGKIEKNRYQMETLKSEDKDQLPVLLEEHQFLMNEYAKFLS